jgi:hypothetical protein
MLLFDTAVPCGSFSYWADALSKLAATIGVVGGGLWALFQYMQARKSEGQTAKLTAKQPFLMKRLELYTDAASCAAAIATSADKLEIEMQTRKFWDMYWGPMAIVEDEKVEKSMVAFGKALQQSVSPDILKIAAIQLAHSCRDSLAQSWEVDVATGSAESRIGFVQ